MKKRILLIPIILAAALILAFLLYTGIYYHADSTALAALNSDEKVSVKRRNYGWFFDGPSQENVLVFYPGAKVEETAYAPLLHDLARQGMDVCLVKMPLRLAIFGENKADKAEEIRHYDKCYIGGHSLGGAIAADYAAQSDRELEGVILLASYPVRQLKDKTSLLNIYGSEDGIVNMDKVSNVKKYVRGQYQEHIIEGGNHAYYGNYGKQRGDYQAKISRKEQQEETVKAILSYIENPADPKENADSKASKQEAQEETATTRDERKETEKQEELDKKMRINEIMELDAGTILTEEDLKGLDDSKLFCAKKISDEVFARMEGISFGEGCTTRREDLRYLRLLHTGFDGETHIGEMVCHREIARDLLDIFMELYKEEYPIEKILLVDEYGGDDELSMEDNNSSCFNFRPVSGTDHLSNHAYGCAVDINPLYNPYITSSGYTPVNAGDYVDREAENPYKIDEDDLCFRLFTEKGFSWGGNWNSVKDYQHFEKE